MNLLMVMLGALAGAPARYVIDQILRARLGPAFPWGTLAVNVLGSAILGVLTAASVNHWIAVMLGSGLCGTLTTFSTFSYETVRLAESGKMLLASCNVALSVGGGLLAAWLGYGVTRLCCP